MCPAALKSSAGHSLSLGREIGKGGEGSVFEIAGNSTHVAKIYHKAISQNKAAKVRLMPAMQNPTLLSLTAWPTEALEDASGKLMGFVMPKVSGHKDIHALYTPKSRKDFFPNANWRFLIRTATNVARAFALVHSNGAVIGDVNHGSVLASPDATVRLIDCDSFQIQRQGQTLFCEVGVPTYTPPELQNRSFAGITRTANHDNFGLAVMIFHLLFMGRHPFSGRFLGNGEMPLEKAIQEHRFAYGANNRNLLMAPPPHTLPLQGVNPVVSMMFEKAFSNSGSNHGRPTANDWISALGGLEKEVCDCSANKSHSYFKSLKECPWCAIEAATGGVLFSFFFQANQTTGGLNVEVLWSRIAQVPLPPAVANISPPAIASFGNQSKNVSPSQEAVDASGNAKLQKATGWLVIFLSAGGVFATGGTLWFILLIAWFATSSLRAGGSVAAKFRQKYEDALKDWNDMAGRWNAETGPAKFNEKLQALRKVKEELEGLPATRQKMYRQLELNIERRQREHWLDSHLIYDAKIQHMGPSRKATLEAYNIETALDITEAALRSVPGFGETYTWYLMEWRRGVERSFKFNPAKGIDPQDVAKLNHQIASMKGNLERSLQAGPAELNHIRNHTIHTQQSLKQALDAASDRYHQAEANKKLLS